MSGDRGRATPRARSTTCGLCVSMLLVACGSPTSTGNIGPSPSAARVTMNVLVLAYYPLTPDGLSIDIGVTGDVGGSAAAIKAHVAATTAEVATALTRGSQYHGYANRTAQPAIDYRVIDTRASDTAVPTRVNPIPDPNYAVVPNYRAILSGVGICDEVTRLGVGEVWIWAYQGPHQLGISESKMSGPSGDISNSARLNDMPECGRTYTVYTFNYQRQAAEAVHSHGHQIEAELLSIDPTLVALWEGSGHPAADHTVGRCGSVHNPPNARFEYDYQNAAPNASDCFAWSPDTLDAHAVVGCASWACTGDGDTSQLNYLIWWMQNIPGIGNSTRYHGVLLRNWWDVHSNFDQVRRCNRTLLVTRPTC